MSDTKEYASFSEEVWDTLSRIDVSKHVDVIEKTSKRPEIQYIAWHTAWALLKRKFPASTYQHLGDIRHPDETVEVEILVHISNGVNTQITNARLSVMDQWMNPISNPTARQVNDSRQRVLVKALAFAGLGLNLWGDETLPVGVMEDPIDEEQLATLVDLIERTETDEEKFLKWCEVDALPDLPLERFRSARGLLEAKMRRKAALEKSK
jgi:hypothetical protein